MDKKKQAAADCDKVAAIGYDLITMLGKILRSNGAMCNGLLGGMF